MNAILTGGAVGTIGVLGGAVLALWWRAKYAEAKGAAPLLLFRLQTEEREHNVSLIAATRMAESLEEELERRELIVTHYKDRLHALHARKLDTAQHAELLAIANGLRVDVPEAETSRGAMANEDGDDSVTLP